MKTSLLAPSAAVLFALAVTMPGLADEIQCARRGMKVDLESRFASKLLQGEKTLFFCDVGDLLGYLKEKSASPTAARVQDRRSGKWIRADAAFYVHSEKAFRTPMGWSIAAFESRAEAAAFGSPMDVAAALRSVR